MIESGRLVQFVLIVVLFCSSTERNKIYAQDNSTIDSLRKVLSLTDTDSLKTPLLYSISKYWTYKNEDSAKFYLNKFRETSQKLDDGYWIFWSCILETRFWDNQNNTSESIKRCHEALKYFDEESEQIYRSNILIYLAEKSRSLKKFDDAVFYLEEALKISPTINDSSIYLTIYNRLAAIYYENNQNDSAFCYAYKSQAINSRHKNLNTNASNLEIIGACLRDEENYTEALKHFYKILDEQKTYSDKAIIPNVLNNISATYYSLGEYEKSVDIGLRAFQISDSLDLLELKSFSSKFLYKSFLAQNLYKEAIKYFEIFHYLENDKIKINHKKLVSELNEKYKTDEKEREIKQNRLLLKSKHRQNLYLAIGLILAFVASLTILFIFLRLRKSNKLLQTKNLEILSHREKLEKTNLQLKKSEQHKEMLSRMIVHDLKQPLNTIINFTKENSQGKYDQLIYESGKSMLNLVMNILELYKFENNAFKLNKSTTPIFKLINDSIKNSFYKSNIKNISFIINTDYEFELEIDRVIIKRVFCNLIDNALRYAPENTEIEICINPDKNDDILVTVKNDGEGIPKDKIQNIFRLFYSDPDLNPIHYSTGIGLRYCEYAIKAHGAKIWVESELGKGAIFFILFPKSLCYKNQKLSQKPIAEKNQPKAYFLSENTPKVALEAIKELQSLEVYSISEILKNLKILDSIEDEYINQWSEELRNAATNCNNEIYTKLKTQLKA